MNEKLNKQLMQAVKFSNEKEIDRLLADGADPNATVDDGWTPLMEAANVGHYGITETLLEAKTKAKPNKKKGYGWTALMEAAHCGHADVVKLLLEKKADPNAVLNGKWTALSAAKEGGHSKTVSILEKEMAKK